MLLLGLKGFKYADKAVMPWISRDGLNYQLSIPNTHPSQHERQNSWPQERDSGTSSHTISSSQMEQTSCKQSHLLITITDN